MKINRLNNQSEIKINLTQKIITLQKKKNKNNLKDIVELSATVENPDDQP